MLGCFPILRQWSHLLFNDCYDDSRLLCDLFALFHLTLTLTLFPAVVDVIPSVIEPSFGIGRILYTILEHSYRVREEDEQRKWLALPSLVAPISCSVLPLSGNEEFIPYIAKIGEVMERGRGICEEMERGGHRIGICEEMERGGHRDR